MKSQKPAPGRGAAKTPGTSVRKRPAPNQRTTRTAGTCFAIMPFGPNFDDISDVIRGAAEECRLKYVRGDASEAAGGVMPQIVHEIKRATIIVADISGHNPNVFYELGIAHHIAGAERVIIITQQVDGKAAYDIHQFRQLHYTQNKRGMALLRSQLPGHMRKATETGPHEDHWSVVRGRLPRTRLIVRDLEQLIRKNRREDLSGTTIRIVAGLSSLAISDREPADPDLGEEYRAALLAERDALRSALLQGAELKAVLNPPRRFTRQMMPPRMHARYERLIGLLEGRSDLRGPESLKMQDVKAMKRCRFALTPVPLPNLFIIGDQIAYEGLKRGGPRGFHMTHQESDPAAVRELIAQFDELFEDSRRETERAFPPDGRLVEQLRAFYAEACASKKTKRR